MLNLTTVANQHTSQGTKLSRHTDQTTCTNRCEPNSDDTPTKLSTPTNVALNDCKRSTFLPRYRTQPTHIPNYNAPTNVELNNHSRSTFLARYQTQPTHLPNLTHRLMLNLTTVTDQHSSQSTKLSRHTYQTIMHHSMLNLTTVTDQHSSQGTQLSRHTYQTTRINRCELNDCRCELNDHSRSTFLPRYQTQPTHLPN